jgi:uncharacterized small protein (DUF1192 family)
MTPAHLRAARGCGTFFPRGLPVNRVSCTDMGIGVMRIEGEMLREDEETPRKRPRFEPLPLDGVSREDMEAYIAALEAEIARVKATITARDSHRGAAEALFRKG